MNLELNTKVKDKRVSNAHDSIMNEISNNLESGNTTTEIYIDKDIASDVRSLILDSIEKAGKSDNFDWATLRKERNSLGNGRMMYFISETIGDQRHYRLRWTA
jgi:hypothetical protein